MSNRHARPERSSRFVLSAALLAAVLIVAAGAIIALAFESPNRAAQGIFGSAIGGRFRLVDQHGKPFTDADLKGKWRLVYFGYTHCPDACPTALNDMAVALDRLGAKAKAADIVFVTVDPARDTPAIMKEYVANFAAPIIGLSGTAAEVAQAAKDYHVYYAKQDEPGGDYSMDHSSLIYVLDPKGQFVATITGDSKPNDIASRLEQLMS